MTTNFIIHGVYCVSNWGGYAIQISNSGDAARVASDFGNGLQNVGHWQEIKYTKGGEPFVNYRGRRLHLDNFLRP